MKRFPWDAMLDSQMTVYRAYGFTIGRFSFIILRRVITKEES